MRLTLLSVLLLAAPVTVTFGAPLPVAYQTTVTPETDEDFAADCRYEITLPVPERPVKAVWVVFERSRDMFRYYGESTVQAFASQHQWALLYAFHCPAKSFTGPRERGDINPDPFRGQGRALFTALRQLGDIAHHHELGLAKIVLLGFSGAGALVARFPGYAPSRVAAVISANPGHFDPFGMETINLSRAAARVPQFIIAGAQDRVSGTQRPYDYFRRHYDAGAPWTFVVQNGVPHCCAENVRPLVLEWLDAVVVRPAAPTRGRFGFVRKGRSDTVDCAEPFASPSNPIWCRGGHDEWGTPNWSVGAASVRSERDVPGEMLPAGWLPTSAFANHWKAFVSQRGHPIASWL